MFSPGNNKSDLAVSQSENTQWVIEQALSQLSLMNQLSHEQNKQLLLNRLSADATMNRCSQSPILEQEESQFIHNLFA